VDEAELLRTTELEASYRSAATLGFDELIDPAGDPQRAVALARTGPVRRQSPAEPKARIGIGP